MEPALPRHLLAIILFVLSITMFSAGVWRVAYSTALDQAANRAEADLRLAADRLVGQLQRYREVAVLLADHPTLESLLERIEAAGPTDRLDRAVNAANAVLLRTADKTGRLRIELLDSAGRVWAGSSPQAGRDHAGAPYLRRALDGMLGTYNAQTAPTGQRVFTFAAPMYSPGGPVRGAVIVTVDIDAVESEWRGLPQTVFFTDRAGVVFISNRSEMLLRQRGAGPGDATGAEDFPPGYLAASVRPFHDYKVDRFAGHEIWALDGGPYLPARAMHLSLPLPVIGLTGELLFDVAPARAFALLQAAVAGAICLAFGAVLLVLAGRRQVLSARLEAEAAAKTVLEERVADRTRELSATNAALLREVLERQEAESVLKRTQADLVQAGKLSALGQMSAGISHELNQPLMAIRSFAENADVFLDRGDTGRARSNLGRISELSRRMGRIIRNLRAFARQENEPITDVDIVAAVEAVLEISESRLTSSGVTLLWSPPDTPPLVRGGEVRLQQVLLNLISNAIDAMEGQAGPRRLEIGVTGGGTGGGIGPAPSALTGDTPHPAYPDTVTVIVRDTGPGIDEPEKIFDPFYSTKEVGSEGMGLGLSISYGLVQSFGGAIRGRNAQGGGAVFTVELARSAMEKAA